MFRKASALLLILFSCLAAARAQYVVAGVDVLGTYKSAKDCYVFVPQGHQDSLNLVVFIHGYGALNPVNYGGWLQEILDQGNAVIFPRYQWNLLVPGTRKFIGNAVSGIEQGLALLEEHNVAVRTDRVVYIGHSYGGTISAHLLAKGEHYGIPRAYGGLLAAPGTNRFKGARLETYEDIPARTHLAIVTHDDDAIVGDELALLIDSTATSAVPRLLIRQEECAYDSDTLGAGHNECYAIDENFDTGYRNYTTKKGFRVGKIDANDTDLYWPLTQALLAGRAAGRPPDWPLLPDGNCDYGRWEDGTPRCPLTTSVTGQENLRRASTTTTSTMVAPRLLPPAGHRDRR